VWFRVFEAREGCECAHFAGLAIAMVACPERLAMMLDAQLAMLASRPDAARSRGAKPGGARYDLRRADPSVLGSTGVRRRSRNLGRV